jgi:flagellar L-ring protein FlgH
MRRSQTALLAIALTLAGCTQTMQEAFEEPKLSQVGARLGTEAEVDPEIYSPHSAGASQENRWIGGPSDYFRDDRARQMGDLVTVKIEIDDRANFNNRSDVSRESGIGASTSFDLGLLGVVGQGQGKVGGGGESSMSGQGSTQRSEKLSIALAAMVRQILPNGHLMISGTQELLVNAEKRVVTIEGIVDPKDISRSNAVEYDRIAEARIYYGGAGSAADAQRAPWGQKVWQKVTPF